MSGSRSGGFSVTIGATDNASRTIDGINKRLASLTAPADRLNRSISKFGDVSGISRLSQGFKDFGASALDSFRSLDRIIAPLGIITGATSLAGVAALVQRFGEFGTRVQNLGYRLSVPVDRLTALEGAARLAGASAGSLDSGLVSLGDKLSGAAWGRDPQAVQLFQSLGVAFRDANGNARQAVDVLGDVAEAIKRLPDPRTQARVTRELFGGDELLPFLRRGREGIAEWQEQVRQLGGTVTPEMAKHADELRKSFAEVGIAAEGLGNTIADRLSGRVSDLNEHLATWIARNKDLIATKIGEWIDKFVEALEKLSAWTERHPQLAGAILGGAIGSRLGPLGTLGGAAIGGMPNVTPFTKEEAGPPPPPGWAPTPEKPALPPYSPWNPGSWLYHSGTEATPGDDASPGFLSKLLQAFTLLPGGRSKPQLGLGGDLSRRGPPASASEAAAVAQRAHDFWRSKGYTEDQTAGILAGMNRESGFDPGVVDPSRSSFGSYQYTGSRLAAIQKRYGTKYPTEAQQNEYAAWEMSPEGPEAEAGRRVRASTTAAQAGLQFRSGFERPANPAEGMATGRDAPAFVGAYDRCAPAGAPVAAGASDEDWLNQMGKTYPSLRGPSDGHVKVDVHLHGAPPGTSAQVTSSGPVSAPPPRIEQPMPGAR
jgi:hypothetical protein